jgi:hypothetical protein
MADKHTEPDIPVTREGGNVVSVLVNPFEVGDCQMNAQARVTLTPPDDAGNTTVTWDADVFTRHTNHVDVWHQSFGFKTRRGTTVLSVENLDGPPLRHGHENEVQHAHQDRSVVVDPDLFDLIAKVDWTGEC